MKTKKELNALKKEVENVIRKLSELTDEELAQVTGGNIEGFTSCNGEKAFDIIESQTYKKDIGSDKNAKVYY